MTTAMHEIRSILEENEKYRNGNPIPSEDELTDIEIELGIQLKRYYREFVLLGGLNDLRFSAEILAHDELVENQIYIQDRAYVAFASNGCGDLFCWSTQDLPTIYFWEHETKEYSENAPDFISWLKQNRFQS